MKAARCAWFVLLIATVVSSGASAQNRPAPNPALSDPVATPQVKPEATAEAGTPTDSDAEEWQGFRGLKWDAKIADAPDMILCRDAGYYKLHYQQFYRRASDTLAIGDAKLQSIRYGFYRGYFNSVSISAKGELNWIALKEAVLTRYGTKCRLDGNRRWWGRDDVTICLTYEEYTEKVSLSMSYSRPNEEEKAERATKTVDPPKDF